MLLRGAERVCWTKWSVAERGDCKRRGRGLGQRNIFFTTILTINISICSITMYSNSINRNSICSITINSILR